MQALSPLGLSELTAALGIPVFAAAGSGVGLFVGITAVLGLCAVVVYRSPRLGAALTATWCAVANGYLLYDKWVPDHGPALCSVSETIDCSAVNSSVYSEAFGLPITLIGLAFYAGLVLAAFAGPRTAPRFHQVNGLFALLSLAYSAYLANASASLGVVCPFCISIYVGNALLLWSALRGLGQSGGGLFDGLGQVFRSRTFVTIAGVFLFVNFVGGAAWQSKQGAVEREIASADDPGAVVAKFYAEAPGTVELDGTEPVLGDPNAPYMVVEWADYGCPHCARAAVDLKQLVAEYPNVQVRFKVFPLDGRCNPGLGERDGAVCLAAAAAECAHEQGRFWELSGNIFRNQQYMSLEDLTFMARDEGLDIERWQACLEAPSTGEAVVADAVAGQKAGVRGTPALYLKGTHGDRFVLVNQGVEGLLQIIKAHQKGIALPEPGPDTSHAGHGH